MFISLFGSTKVYIWVAPFVEFICRKQHCPTPVHKGTLENLVFNIFIKGSNEIIINGLGRFIVYSLAMKIAVILQKQLILTFPSFYLSDIYTSK